MMEYELSEAEKLFVIHGIQDQGFRNDGRRCEDFRPVLIETSVIDNTSGSARVRVGNTDILVGVKAEIGVPLATTPDEGRVQFFVDCSANATPEFEGRGGQELGESIASALSSAYENKVAVGDLKNLCLLSKTFCWVLYVDVVLLECGGNLFDVASFAVKGIIYKLSILFYFGIFTMRKT